MTEVEVCLPGRFVWHELMTPNIDTSLAFYLPLFGWTKTDHDMGGGMKYSMLNAGDREIGGVMPIAADSGIPSHWLPYVTVTDVDATCARAADLGGAVAMAAKDIPHVGRFAVISDPTRATLAPFKGMSSPGPESDDPPALGTFCWNELLTNDPTAAREFYREIFAWDTTEWDMGEMGTYWIYRRGDKDEAGMMKMPVEAAHPPFWLPYVAVADVDVSAARVRELGGQLFVPPSDIPNVGRFSVCGDPTGASFGLYKKNSPSD